MHVPYTAVIIDAPNYSGRRHRSTRRSSSLTVDNKMYSFSKEYKGKLLNELYHFLFAIVNQSHETPHFHSSLVNPHVVSYFRGSGGHTLFTPPGHPSTYASLQRCMHVTSGSPFPRTCFPRCNGASSELNKGGFKLEALLHPFINQIKKKPGGGAFKG